MTGRTRAQLRMAPYDCFRPPPFPFCVSSISLFMPFLVQHLCVFRLFLLFYVETIVVVRVHSRRPYLANASSYPTQV